MTQKWSCSRTQRKLASSLWNQGLQRRRQQQIVLLQSFQNGAGGKVQLGQTAAVVLHLFDELEGRMTLRQNPGGGAGGDAGERQALPWLETESPAADSELALDLPGMRLQDHG